MKGQNSPAPRQAQLRLCQMLASKRDSRYVCASIAVIESGVSGWKNTTALHMLDLSSLYTQPAL